jgi:putative ABC transport system permease protein
MIIRDIFRMAVKNLLKRKTRALISLIGVVIGTTCIVVMMSIGVGMDTAFNNELNKSGSIRIITVSPKSFLDEPISKKSLLKLLDDNAIRKICKIEGVDAVSPELNANLKFAYGKYLAHIDLIGINPDRMDEFGYEIMEGRQLKEKDKNEVIFGNKVPDQFYNISRKPSILESDQPQKKVNFINQRFVMSFDLSYGDSVDEENSPRKRTYNSYCVGVLKESGQSDYSVYMNINHLRKLIMENDKNKINNFELSGAGRSPSLVQYDKVLVKVESINDIERIQKEIYLMGFEVHSLIEVRNQMSKTLNIIQVVLGAIGSITLLVASLGITNTMYMSVYERTKEIGVIKVLGCNLDDIGKLFLAEAGLLGFTGGIAGLVISYIISGIINLILCRYLFLLDSPISIISVNLAVFSVLFSVLTAGAAGYFPSIRAMRISAIEAIRSG